MTLYDACSIIMKEHAGHVTWVSHGSNYNRLRYYKDEPMWKAHWRRRRPTSEIPIDQDTFTDMDEQQVKNFVTLWIGIVT